MKFSKNAPCIICNDSRVFKRLDLHLKNVHNMEPEEYEAAYLDDETPPPRVPTPITYPETTGNVPVNLSFDAPPVNSCDPDDQAFINQLRQQRRVELEALKLESIRSMTRDLRTPPEQKSGGVLEKLLATVIPPLMNKAVNTDNITEQINRIEDRMEDLLQGIPPENREQTGDAISTLLEVVKTNPEIIGQLIKRFMGGT